jgi:hypothetical protein
MKQFALFTIAMLSFIAANAQSDTVWVLNNPKIGTAKIIIGEYLTINTDNVDEKINLQNISKLSISQSNPNKLFMESQYMIWLSENNKKNSSVVVKKDKQPKTLLTAGDYLQRGANKQLTGLGIGIAGAAVGAVMFAALEKPTAGYVVIGVGGLIGGILNIAGIVDYGKAGALLNNGKIGSYQK